MATYGTLAADGDTDIVWVDGPAVFHAAGTWGGGTFTIKFLGANGQYKTFVTDAPIVSDATGQILVDMPEMTGAFYKATLAGATTPSLAWEFRGRECKGATP